MKYSIVTGGSSGLGMKIAEELVKKNINVIIIGRDKEKIDTVVSNLIKVHQHVHVLGYTVNIGNEEEVLTFYRSISHKQIEFDYLYNVAGVGFFGELEKITSNDILRVFESNLIGLILMTVQAVRHMKRFTEHKCRIVNVLSTAALGAKKFETIYYAAKWGARGFIESVKDELVGSNIEMITVLPGGMNTGFWKNIDSGYDFSNFMKPEEVAKTIVDASLNEKMLVSELIINRRK